MENLTTLQTLIMPFLFLLYFIFLIFPIAVSVFAIIFFNDTKNDDWNKKSKKIVRYVLLAILLFLNLYYLYGLKFIDPEYLLLYIIWPFPVGVSLVWVTFVTIRRKISSILEKRLAYVVLVIGIFTLIAPYIFSLLREHNVL